MNKVVFVPLTCKKVFIATNLRVFVPLKTRINFLEGGIQRKKAIQFLNRFFSGSRGSRTPDPLLVRQML